MKEERYFYVPDAETATELPQEEAVHATRVLRLQEGDTIYLMDGKGCFYHAEVTMTSGKRCSYSILEKLQQQRPWHGATHLAMAPTKMMDRTEWMAEKATEIGFDELSFLECKFSERKVIRTDRMEKIVVAATKQSRKAWKPVINEMTPFRKFIEQPREGLKFICHCYNEVERKELSSILEEQKKVNADVPVTILVGPEGDFSIDEVRMALDNGYQSVSLGNQRLRTETACLYSVMIASLFHKI